MHFNNLVNTYKFHYELYTAYIFNLRYLII